MESTMGSHQGDPLGSMIYSADQQQLLSDVLNQLSSKPTGRIRAFIDDISVQGNINDIQETSLKNLSPNHPNTSRSKLLR